jgi:flagellar basal-body rod protein FlgG
LTLLGGSLYQETDASGPPIEGKPGENGSGQILQGFLEASNVDPVKELVTLIKTQRAFELNSQSIQTADQALQTIGNLRRS